MANIRQFSEPGAETAKQALELMQMMTSHAFAIGVVDSIIELLVCGSLIYGVNEGKPFWMLPWLILRGIALVVSFDRNFNKKDEKNRQCLFAF